MLHGYDTRQNDKLNNNTRRMLEYWFDGFDGRAEMIGDFFSINLLTFKSEMCIDTSRIQHSQIKLPPTPSVQRVLKPLHFISASLNVVDVRLPSSLGYPSHERSLSPFLFIRLLDHAPDLEGSWKSTCITGAIILHPDGRCMGIR